MIKQFNFYDIYGYLLPGIVLLALFYMPVGFLTQSWPDQDLSKAVFLTVLSYVVGHVLQTVANSVVPSTVPGPAKQRRFPSELLLDQSNSRFTAAFKARLAAGVAEKFGLDLQVILDGDGTNQVSTNRQIAFFQARSSLIAKKAEQYSQQFEGLYVMMRGLGCAFCAGAAYFLGWALSIRRGGSGVSNAIPALVLAATACALIFALVAFFRDSAKNAANRWLTAFLLLALAGSGFVAGTAKFQPIASSTPFPSYPELVLWGSTLLALFAAVKCFSAYKGFAMNFAETIWRDFSANMYAADAPGRNAANAGDQ